MSENILYFDCLSGISGDMSIGALLDLGIDLDVFKRELDKLNIDGYKIEIQKKQKNGITGTDFDVIIEACSHDHSHTHTHDGKHEHDHNHEHSHTHDDKEHEHHHEHGNVHDHSHHHEQDHVHRNLNDITRIIEASDISQNAKDMSKKIFRNVANAESKVHGKSIEEVHFHEVGAIDSIVDIVGFSICLDLLKVKHVYSSPIHLGTGFVKCAHGVIPVPSPATMEILKGVPVYSKGLEHELVTPTGAAIIKAVAEDFAPMPSMIIEKTGYGLGKRDIEITNLLRVVLGKKKLPISY